MAQFELIMPKMGESIIEATILRWVKQVGDSIDIDETIAEIATDKVDSEVPSPIGGTIAKILFQENDTVPVGAIIALIDTAANGAIEQSAPKEAVASSNGQAAIAEVEATLSPSILESATIGKVDTARFYSPLVRNIAQQENITVQELEAIEGSGLQGRVTKRDVLAYIDNRQKQPAAPAPSAKPTAAPITSSVPASSNGQSGNVEIVEMDRMRRLIADHMVMSKQTSPHVTSFVEADVTELVKWREKVKGEYLKRYNEKITFTPIFVEAVAKAIRDYPLVNVSVEGNTIVVKKDINIGMAAALPSGNLIVPVIRHADQHNLAGLTKMVNDLANRARNNQLKPEDIQGGTFTLTNVGTFGNVMGTPIINQPQAAILATGAIRKKPAVIETEYGDLIAVRQMMFLSLSYDHRVVDGFLGGSFLRRVADYLEGFDPSRMV